MSQAYTSDEIREQFLAHLHNLVDHWESQNTRSIGKLNGLCFSILSIFDGVTSLPAIDLVVRPHEDDKAYHIAENKKYYENGTVINDCMLHEEWCG